MRTEVTDFAFHIWLEPLEPAGRDAGTLFVRAPEHIRSWVRERYGPRLRAAARRLDASLADVEIVGADWRLEPAGRAVEPAAGNGVEDRLNPKYTFEQFVIGCGNRFGHAAALAVAEQPAQAYNPLFLHGPPGLGKTHLLHAIGNFVRRYGGGLKVRYTTIEAFTTEFVAALRSGGNVQDFKRRFRGIDVLLVDDIQFLASKERTKEEFFHTFNALYEAGAQLVITSDRPPGELADVEDRLRERFASGLVVELEPPDLDVRLAILRQRARHDGLDGIAEEALRAIAEQAADSVRSLEAALIRVVAFASLQGLDLSADVARQVLGRLGPRVAGRPTIEEIQTRAAESFGVTRDDLLARDRRPHIAFARQVAMYLARELTDESLPAIARTFGGRDHASVLRAHRRVADALPSNTEIAQAVERLRSALAEPDRGR